MYSITCFNCCYFFPDPAAPSEATIEAETNTTFERVEALANSARIGSRQLQNQSAESRTRILLLLGEYLESRAEEILVANEVDIRSAEERWDLFLYLCFV